MNTNDELELLKRIHHWLRPGGKFIIDCCESADISSSWTKTFSEGEVSCQSSLDSSMRMQQIDFSFTPISGSVFGLFDPIRNNKPGISRYLYPREELRAGMTNAGFEVEEIPHYYKKNYYGLLGAKK